ncbi:hypothetical protein BT69DRAFT_1278040 [Atractiella rhizophila]|nr:hypothetical protein BT69DRAFT_1278040 [Atractiella rhizophila]
MSAVLTNPTTSLGEYAVPTTSASVSTSYYPETCFYSYMYQQDPTSIAALSGAFTVLYLFVLGALFFFGKRLWLRRRVSEETMEEKRTILPRKRSLPSYQVVTAGRPSSPHAQDAERPAYTESQWHTVDFVDAKKAVQETV